MCMSIEEDRYILERLVQESAHIMQPAEFNRESMEVYQPHLDENRKPNLSSLQHL